MDDVTFSHNELNGPESKMMLFCGVCQMAVLAVKLLHIIADLFIYEICTEIYAAAYQRMMFRVCCAFLKEVNN